jgi:hypothetical protein
MAYCYFFFKDYHYIVLELGFRWTAHKSGFDFGQGKRFLSTAPRPDWLWGPANLLFSVPGTVGVKRPVRETDDSPPFSAEVDDA